MSMVPNSTVVLPAGWTIGPWRETSQANQAGIIVQGIAFTLVSPAGSPSTVFVPNNLLASVDAVQAAFSARIAAITAITG